MTTPRTISGRAAISAMRPYVKRALGTTIVAIETEAAAPFMDALGTADQLLAKVAVLEATSAWDEGTRLDLVAHAAAAHRLVRQLLDQPDPEEAA